MIKRSMLVFFLFCLGAKAETLCGPADHQVCLQNSFTLELDGLNALHPGSAFVISVPGVSADPGLVASGTPTAAYRISQTGSIDDDQGGIWSPPTVLAVDRNGVTSLAFVLQETSLVSPVAIHIKNIEVCQLISDGPADVTLKVQLFVNFNKTTSSVIPELSFKAVEDFDPCPESAGNLPLLKSDFAAVLANPHDEPVMLTIDQKVFHLGAHRQMTLNGSFSTVPNSFTSSKPLPMVLKSEQGDLNLVSLPTQNHSDWFLPHLGRDEKVWRNRWIFAADARGILDWKQDGNFYQASYRPGVNQVDITAAPDHKSTWALLETNGAFNGFFEFSLLKSEGGAWVNGVRLDGPTVGHTRLVLPHVAKDHNSFWTGFSLANPNGDSAKVTMTAIGENLETLSTESFEIPADQNEIGLVGIGRFRNLEGISWIAIDSDLPLAGLELIGDNARQNFSGFLLPHLEAAPLSFPLLLVDGNYWSGIGMVNTADSDVAGVFSFYSRDGVLVGERPLTLRPFEKSVFLVPAGAALGIYRGDPLIGFCLIGQNGGGKMGGYLGL